MSLRKARFVHYQTLEATPYRGFSVLISPELNQDGYVTDRGNVNVQVSLCHKVDHFCRKTGRDSAAAKEAQVIRVVDLPLFLAELQAKCWGYRIPKNNQRAHANAYAWVWKYFL